MIDVALQYSKLFFWDFVVTLYSGTIFFDFGHWLLHICAKSDYKILRAIAYPHMVHHYWYDRKLKYNPKYDLLNTLLEYPLEMLCTAIGIWLWTRVFTVNPDILTFVYYLHLWKTLMAMAMRGRDTNHIERYNGDTAKPYKDGITVDLDFHRQHHLEPLSHYTSFVRIFDWIIGTAYWLRRRRAVITGANGAFAKALAQELRAEGAELIGELHHGTDFGPDHLSERTISLLQEADILILAHGAKSEGECMKGNYDTFKILGQKFIEIKENSGVRKTDFGWQLLPPELWGVGSEIEFSSADTPLAQEYLESKRKYAKLARGWVDNDRVFYRHIVPSAFTSPLNGPSEMSAETAAKLAMFFIRRGAHYVPVTWTGVAYLNFFKFYFFTKNEKTEKAKCV